MDNNLFNEKIKGKNINNYIHKMHEGDPIARDKIISHYVCIVKDFIEQNYTKDKEDLLSAGTIGIIRAVDSYDFSMMSHLTTLVFTYAKKEINKYLQIDENENNVKQILLDDEANIIDDYEVKEKYENLNHIIDLLPGFDGVVIKLYFGIGCKREYTEQEIATILDLSKTRISAILGRSLTRLENVLNFHPIKKSKRGIIVQSFFSIFEGYTKEQIKNAVLKIENRRIDMIGYLYKIKYDNAIKRWNELDERDRIMFCRSIDEIRVELKKEEKQKKINLSKY